MPLPLIALAVCCGAPVVLAGAAWLATKAREARGAERPAKNKEQKPADQTSASGLRKQAGGERRR